MAAVHSRDVFRPAQDAQIGADTLEAWLPRSCLIYVTDTRYLPLTLTSLLMASRTKPANMDARLYLDDVPSQMRSAAEAFLREWGVDAELQNFDINALPVDPARIPLWREGISRAGFARLGLCGAPEGYDTHIVLDGDTLVAGDLRELVAMRPAAMAAVSSLHPVETWAYLYEDRKMPVARDYFNAGLLVINPAFWHRERIVEHAAKLAEDRSLDGHYKRPMRDEEIFNLIFGDTFHRLDPMWNFKKEQSWDQPKSKPAIAHFAGRLAPWDARDQRSLPVFRQIYQEVFSRLPKPLAPAIESLQLSGRNLRHGLRFKPSLGRWNRNPRKAWNPAHAPVVADWAGLLPWNA